MPKNMEHVDVNDFIPDTPPEELPEVELKPRRGSKKDGKGEAEKKLQKLDVTGCRDYALLEKLAEARPELDVHYTVLLGEGEYSHRVEELTLEHADPDQLAAALPYLKNLTRVTFVGKTPDQEQMCYWKAEYVEFS